MQAKRNRFRHLPPSAVPIKAGDLAAGLRPSGQVLEQFRTDLAAYLGVQPPACQLASSGRTALYCLLQGLKSENPFRKQIIMPAYTCPAVARVALDLQLQPIYVDLSPQTLIYDQEQLRTAVNENTLAVVIVHPFGIPLPVDEIVSLAQNVGAVVIEDAAQSLGARWDGYLIGTRADFGLFSLGPGKPISTGGGGIVIANNPDNIPMLSRAWAGLSTQAFLGSMQAWLRQASFQLAFHPLGWWAATRIGLHRVGNHEASWGYKLTSLSPTQAAIGRNLLPRLEAINSRRRHNAGKMAEAVKHASSLNSIQIPEQADPIFLRFPIIAASNQQREELFAQLWSSGIGVGRLYEETLPIIFATKDEKIYPGAEIIAHQLLTLPTHHYVTEEDLQTMCRIIAQA